MAGGTGFGATSDDSVIAATVDSTLTLTEPVGLEAAPAPTTGVTWTSGSPNLLHFGDVAGQDVASASATWKVSTNSGLGYELTLANPNSAPVLQGPGRFPDMAATPTTIDPTKTAFGVAIGNSTSHNQSSVDNISGQPWGTTGVGGTQGTLYRGVPVGGMVIGTRSSAVTDDEVTVNFVANLSSSEPVPYGAYAGFVRFTALNL